MYYNRVLSQVYYHRCIITVYYHRCIIKPVAEQFCPDIVLISAGFNSMAGHDSYNVTAECFAFMTQVRIIA